MTNLTLHQKRVIYQILILIMEADMVIMPQEIEFLDKVFNDFGLGKEEFDHLEDMDIDLLCKELSGFDDEAKLYAKELFIGMANCDGYYDPRERAIINKLYQ